MRRIEDGLGWRRRARRVALGVGGLVGALGTMSMTTASCGDQTVGEAAPAPAAAESVGEAREAVTGQPTCVTLQRTLASGTIYDTQIQGTAPTKNYGASGTANTGNVVTNPGERRTLLSFDLSAVPAGAFVTSAVVTLNASTSATRTVNVHRVTAPWNEMLVTWGSFANAFDPVPSTSFGSGPAQTWVNAQQAVPVPVTFHLEPLVQAWLDGTSQNHGILLEQAFQGSDNTLYRTGEWFPVAERPKLDVCFTVTCPAGFADCNHLGADGCETPLGTTSNCGACGDACSYANAAGVCNGGQCALGACNLGWADCDGAAQNGCETMLTTAANCGGCGVACALPHASSSCSTGTCTLVACDPGFANCDGNGANGCEPLPCGNGGQCTTGAQCGSGICQNGFCASASCSDAVQNGNETGTDCGGSCPPCGNGGGCAANADCQSGVCVNGACQAASCSDAVKNGSETDVDCGGSCLGCASGQTCQIGADCQSGACVGGVCQAPACTDGIKNGSETAVDCGGASCPACPGGQTCSVGTDCQSQVCVGGVCQSATCTDGVQNGSETDVDCGGGTCPTCAVATHCSTNADCVSGVCLNGTCQAPTCSDHVQNGNETAVDCGGSCYQPETCNGLDDDCNGLVDDGLGTITCGLGACQITVPACAGGVPGTCTPGLPGVEICDGLLDEDCDGVVDNGCSCVNGTTQPCYTGAPSTLGVGTCFAGVQTCMLGQWGACVGEVTPTQETCDGLDNDCNGVADDGLGQTVCGVGACQVSVPNCLNGVAQQCVPSDPSPETCDGIDNDCNGITDDNLPATTCGVGACAVTVPSCMNGQPAACTPGQPSAETCNGLDDDCDGVADNGNPEGGLACNTGLSGACSAGTTQCAGGTVVCAQTHQPSAETCNGLDDDCDGQVDEGNPGGGAACSTGQQGACSAGTTVCSGGQLTCNATVQPTAEVCDGIDNDCDGQVDEGNPGGGGACNTGLAGACSAGTTSCAGGQVVCAQTSQPTAEVCGDGIDNDCNGQVDENCGGACQNGATRSCYTGPAGTAGVGACHAGTETCTGGAWGPCNGEALPASETCDGLDNDCNGQVDEGMATITCGTGACQRTVPSCVGGAPQACTPGAPQPEVCDNVDNDCDGVVDDNPAGAGASCATGLLGVCGAGTTVCIAGALQCAQNVPAAANDDCATPVDDNCNGQVNEGCVCVPNGTQSCYTGPAGTNGVGACHSGTQTCNATGTALGACVGQVTPTTESCSTAVDDNCNGQVNEGCVCTPFSTQSCYSGPAGTQGIGACKAGTRTCNSAGTAYGACTGEVLPATESCQNSIDDDCDGQNGEGCSSGSCGFNTETFGASGFPTNQTAGATSELHLNWCSSTPSAISNMPMCMNTSAGIRTNPGSNAVFWVDKGNSTCTGFSLSFRWGANGSHNTSVRYRTSSDTDLPTSCSSTTFSSTALTLPATVFNASGTCNTGTANISFGSGKSAYVQFYNQSTSNTATWFDNVAVTLTGCTCN